MLKTGQISCNVFVNVSTYFIYLCTYISLTASVVKWSEFLTTDSEVPGSSPGASRFSERYRGFERNGVHSASRGQLRNYLKEKVAAAV
jgi:hypothetical protein